MNGKANLMLLKKLFCDDYFVATIFLVAVSLAVAKV